MKRMIISPAQLKAINEASIDGGTFTDSGNLTNQVRNDMPITGNTPFSYTNANTAATGPNLSLGRDEVETGITNNPDITNAKSIKVVPESRYTKRQVELGRMLEIRRTGKVYSKKQLNELFLNSRNKEE